MPEPSLSPEAEFQAKPRLPDLSAPEPTPTSESQSEAPPSQATEPPMLDVHPPHQSVHTWTDFFIHMATIVLGLLIAIGLEQSVEAVHHSHQRRDLRESLERESRQILKDSTETEANENIHLAFNEERVAQLREAAWGHGTFPSHRPSPKLRPSFFPDDPIWRSAKTSGLVDLLTQPEINAYSEVELLIGLVDKADEETSTLVGKVRSFEEQLPRQKGSSEPDFSALSMEDRRQYLALMSELVTANRKYCIVLEDAWGAEEAILRGERNLDAIMKAEKTHRNTSSPQNK